MDSIFVAVNKKTGVVVTRLHSGLAYRTVLAFEGRAVEKLRLGDDVELVEFVPKPQSHEVPVGTFSTGHPKPKAPDRKDSVMEGSFVTGHFSRGWD